MNRSLKLNFWPILYDSIVFLCLQTQCLSKTKHNWTFRMGQKISSKLLFRSLPNTDGFYTFYISQGSVATQLRCGGMFGNHFTTNFSHNTSVKKVWKSFYIWQRYWQNFVAYFFGGHPVCRSVLSSMYRVPVVNAASRLCYLSAYFSFRINLLPQDVSNAMCVSRADYSVVLRRRFVVVNVVVSRCID